MTPAKITMIVGSVFMAGFGVTWLLTGIESFSMAGWDLNNGETQKSTIFDLKKVTSRDWVISNQPGIIFNGATQPFASADEKPKEGQFKAGLVIGGILLLVAGLAGIGGAVMGGMASFTSGSSVGTFRKFHIIAAFICSGRSFLVFLLWLFAAGQKYLANYDDKAAAEKLLRNEAPAKPGSPLAAISIWAHLLIGLAFAAFAILPLFVFKPDAEEDEDDGF